MKNQIIYLICTLIFFLIINAFSQNPQWIVYDTTNSGLPYNVVECIAIDESNNKWIGTSHGGLAKFDGTDWVVYDTSNSGLPENCVGCIAIDKSNNIWIGTNDFGLVKFDGTNWAVYDTINSNLPSNQTFSIVIDELNTKWVGTEGGLAKFDGMDWTVYDTSNSGLPNNCVWRFAIDEASNKWFYDDIKGWEDGVQNLIKFHANDTTWTTFTNSDTLLPSRFDDIAVDASNNVWILGRESNSEFIRLIKFDGNNWTVYYDNSASFQSFSPFSLKIDESNNIWIATRYNGVKKFDGVNWTTYDTTNSSFFTNHTICLSIDNYGNKWIGTWSGLAIFNEGGIVSVDENDIFNKTIPNGYKLSQNYPNPFNPSTTIEFDLPKSSEVTLKIYNTLGEEIFTLLSASLLSGSHKYEWNASSLASGVYLYRLQAGDYVETRKMVLMK